MISPLVRRRRLAVELRKLRVEAHLSNAEMARKVGWGTTKVSRLENATIPPNMADVMRMLRVLEVPAERAHMITAVARDAAERGWWADFGKYMGERQALSADLEWGAESITEYHNVVIPGLLQTANYTYQRGRTSLLRGDIQSDSHLDRIVEARLARQQMVRRPGGPRYEAIIDETVLLRPQAEAQVMREQLREIAELMESDSPISVRVLPIKAVVADYWLPASSFSVFTYPDPQDPDVIMLEAEAADTLLSDESEVAPYRLLSEQLRAAALSPDDTIARLREAAK